MKDKTTADETEAAEAAAVERKREREQRRASRVAMALRQVSGTHPVLQAASTKNPATNSAAGLTRTRLTKKQRREARRSGDS